MVFDGTASTGVAGFDDGVIEWSFGDGFKAKIIRATHVYRKAGSYSVSLTVKSSSGQTNTATTTVTVASIPAATGNNVLTVVTNGSGNGTTTFNTVQSAINRAATLNGSAPLEIILPAGAQFEESLFLTVPTGNHYITLKSSKLANLPAGKRVDRLELPASNSDPNMANFVTLLTPDIDGVVRTVITAGTPSHHYRFQGIQFKVKPGITSMIYQVIQLGINNTSQNAESTIPHHFIIDRCLVYRDDYDAT